LYEQSLAIAEKALGPEHPDVAASLNNLAALLRAQGSYAEARPLLERSLAIREKALGPEHPDVATALNNLAVLLEDIGSYSEARHFFERGFRTTLRHISKNLGDMTEVERFRYLDIQTGPEPLLLNLATLQGDGPNGGD
jgi:tetratricopeptide (TPR) repeat protein